MVDRGRGNLDLLSCGFISGVLQAVIFNPWDRALYLSVKNLRPFIHSSNFEEPMRGVLQTLVQRSVSSGLYFPLEDIFRRDLIFFVGTDRAREWRTLLNFSAGIFAGMLNGVIMNPASSVKVYIFIILIYYAYQRSYVCLSVCIVLLFVIIVVSLLGQS